MASFAFAAVILAGAAPAAETISGEVEGGGGDYEVVAFEVPAGTAEIGIEHETLSDSSILDFGVWAPDGFRGWSGGLDEPIAIGEDAASRGYLPGPVEAGTWEIAIGKARLDDPPVGYEIDVAYRDEATLTPRARAPREPVTLEEGARWYRGDFHVHSLESGDASAEIEAIVELARERGLDFVVVTDHNTVSHVERIAALQDDVDDLLLIPGIEVTTYRGHGNAFGVTEYVDHRVGLGGRAIDDVIGDVREQGGLFSVSHPAIALGDLCIGCEWQYEDTPWEDVSAIEIHTGPYEAAALFAEPAIDLWEEAASAGHRIAAIGGSDDHHAGVDLTQTQAPIGSPTTLVRAEALSEAAILDGVRAGRTVVKLSGPNDPDLALEIEGGGERARIGGAIEADEVEVTVRAEGAEGLSLALFRNGNRAETAAIEGDDHEERYSFETSLEGEDRYRAVIREGSVPRVATSHAFAAREPGGGGCAAGGAAGGASGLALVSAIGWLVFRRRAWPWGPLMR